MNTANQTTKPKPPSAKSRLHRFVTTLIAAWLYNVLAGAVGGIELDLE